jgi:hypothetical protein
MQLPFLIRLSTIKKIHYQEISLVFLNQAFNVTAIWLERKTIQCCNDNIFPRNNQDVSLNTGAAVKEKDIKMENSHQLILYVEKEDQTYGPVQTSSYLADNYLNDFFEKKEKLKAARLEELKAGKISPLAYYKDLVDIGEGDLACRVGVSRRKLRFQMTPSGFSKANVATLERYATVFGVPVAQLFQIILCDDEGLVIRNEPTALPTVIISRISLQNTRVAS